MANTARGKKENTSFTNNKHTHIAIYVQVYKPRPRMYIYTHMSHGSRGESFIERAAATAAVSHEATHAQGEDSSNSRGAGTMCWENPEISFSSDYKSSEDC